MSTSVLALEADPAQTEIIRRVAHDMVEADVTVVDSLERAVQRLFAETPDVILLPALLSPADESDLFSVIRQLPNAGHVEVLTTPTFCSEESQTDKASRAWLRWGWNGPSPKSTPSDRGVEEETRLFAERLGWALEVARARRRSVVPSAAPASSGLAAEARPSHFPEDDDRRQQRRVYGPFEGRWRGPTDTPVSIRDISEGGCFVNAFCEIEVGRKLTLTVELPGRGTIEANGLVVHAQPGLGFAVRFVDVADQVLPSP